MSLKMTEKTFEYKGMVNVRPCGRGITLDVEAEVDQLEDLLQEGDYYVEIYFERRLNEIQEN